MGGYLDYETGLGPTFENITIIIPFVLGRHFGNTLIGLQEVGAAPISYTSPCGQSSPGQLL